MNRRPGITLMEVLMAIFISALGLLALLTLFPLGALSMAQAIRDDRCSVTAANAMASLRIWDLHFADTAVVGVLENSVYPPPAMLPMVWPPASNPGYPKLPSDGPSNSVFVDPFTLLNNNSRTTVGGVLLPRATVNAGVVLLTSSGPVNGWCSNLDDLGFTVDGRTADGFGTPASAGADVDRGGRYSWGALLRRPRAGESLTEVSIVVFDGRPLNTVAEELTYAASIDNTNATPDPRLLIVASNPTSGPPAIKPGMWLMVVWQEQNQILREYGFAPIQAFFYRAVGTFEHPSIPSQFVVELQNPLRTVQVPARGDVNGDGVVDNSQYAITSVVIMDTVAEVFDRGILGP